jgi:hypothetical protein
MKEKGPLPVGVEFNGKVHRDFVLRSRLVKDSVEIMESDVAARADKNDSFYGVCLMARQIEKLGEIPVEEITPELPA